MIFHVRIQMHKWSQKKYFENTVNQFSEIVAGFVSFYNKKYSTTSQVRIQSISMRNIKENQ